MRGNKRTFPKLSPYILISMNSNSFYYKTLEWREYDLFHLKKWKGVRKWFEFHLKYFKFRNFKQLNEFIKWLLHIWRKRVGSFKEINWKSLWSYLKLIFSIQSCLKFPNSNPIGSYLSFFSKYFLLKINKWK